ncbi:MULTISPECIES: Bcr/CflA family efflux MFS transporter [Pelosinus]|uniref:Bcr/CflA family efflux transporter n=1 Tax=Pelosinus fermentans B4 TaxID=1149862 RepID=I9LH91_9FIRM|nr:MULTISPECIES: Bcr/CflA family efflux MFS transporter [Pelosinus]EIW19756.1 drug resistance transporter, Bcr/CflA subfamily [Pelosinus fermentans B4]EIW21387.1 drug resistance transporter, Bcr/CflA subfamily [Pelosinus fermentans A11]OAM94909.1 drug resistance transporter, Bcr/CflA subfamily [Pelosinus fermentans DSM 17108]SDR20155.1 MFS transporter, DHA1 family, bicyclomycin/chloramphenicol resistance protein [Pelosinus fermentans]
MNKTDIIEIAVTQKYLGSEGLVAFITLMNMFIPLSTDLYLPALPSMGMNLDSSAAIINLTLSAFFFFYAVGMLVWGPLSDKYGRKPILIVGSLIYLLSSIFCAVAVDAYLLILARAFQGIGAGGITAVSVAMVKDCFIGKKRDVILAITQSMSALAPMIAPIIGVFVIQYVGWRGTFWTLSIIAIGNLVLSLLYQETLKDHERNKGSILESMGRLIVVAQNKSFFFPAVIFALSAFPFMGYIAVSSYIYIDYFGLSQQAYSYFFAINAFISIAGPIIYVRYLRNFNKNAIAAGAFVLSIVSGILVMTIGSLSPVIFLLSFIIMSFTGSAIRPFSTNILFDQINGDTGSVSSLMGILFTVMGSCGMLIASMPWGNIVISLGAMIAIFSGISLVAWYVFMKSDIPCAGIKE